MISDKGSAEAGCMARARAESKAVLKAPHIHIEGAVQCSCDLFESALPSDPVFMQRVLAVS